MHYDVEMIAHDGPGVHAAGKNLAEFQNAGFNPGSSVFEAFAQVFVQAAQPRSAHAAVHTVKGARLCWIDELAAGLGHELSLPMLGLRGDRAGPRVESDFSEGWVSACS